MPPSEEDRDSYLEKAAERGNPSFVWRSGQDRRLRMILDAAGERAQGKVLVDGCGVGMYLGKLNTGAAQAVGLDIELERCRQAHLASPQVVCASAGVLPMSTGSIDLVLSHEVLEHVGNDRDAVEEMTRVLRPGGRMVVFCPNRGHPFETHGIYWRGTYRFGNAPLVNYLPRSLRDRLAPHVRAYARRDLDRLIAGLPLGLLERKVVFGAYDNVIARWPRLGAWLRGALQALESTPLRVLGLSHVWVLEKRDTT